MGLHTATVELTRGPPKSTQSCGRYMARGSDGLPNCGFRPFATRIIFDTASCDDTSGAEIAACQSLTSDLVV